MFVDNWDRAFAMQAIAFCDQCEQALLERDVATIEYLRQQAIKYFKEADRSELRVAVMAIRSFANQVLQEDYEP